MYIEVISYIKNIVSNTNRSTQPKKESRETISYTKRSQTLVNHHRSEFVSVNSFIYPVHVETVIKQKQTLTKNEDRNISVRLFEGIVLNGVYVPSHEKVNNLTGETIVTKSKIVPKAHITRTYCDKISSRK